MALAARNGAPTDLPGWAPANLTSVAPQPNRCRIGRTSPAGVAELQHRPATVNSSCAYWETGSDWLGEATRASACRSSARYRLRLARGGREVRSRLVALPCPRRRVGPEEARKRLRPWHSTTFTAPLDTLRRWFVQLSTVPPFSPRHRNGKNNGPQPRRSSSDSGRRENEKKGLFSPANRFLTITPVDFNS